VSKTSRWVPDRWHERLAYKRGEDDWKTEAAEELEQMTEPEEIYVVVTEWEYNDHNFDDVLAYHRSKAGAWLTLQKIAEGQGYDLPHNEHSFYKNEQEWYVTTAILEK
jgi:hypothetical protein